jgi:uncharacterized protein (DUF1800 family)
MLHTNRPLQEKMTLFWHGHLTSGLRKVKSPDLLYNQNAFLRAHALGSFPELMRGISRDAAMIRWLDLGSNRKAAPNENYARELLELFTMGTGNYSEADVRDAARAFTGWSATPTGAFVFNRNRHDFGIKEVLGRTGALDGDDVTDTVVHHPATARFIAGKLFRFFVHPNPEPASIDRLADVYQRSGASIRAVVESILRSPELVSESAYRALIKSPAELLVGALRTLGAEHVPEQVGRQMRLLGQDLFNPPSVAGWFGGRSWINAATLLSRFNALAATVNQAGGPVLGGQGVSALLQGASSVETRVDRALELLLQGDVSPSERASLLASAGQLKGEEQARGVFRLTMALPAYQLN